ncbi:glutathione S-transferase 1-like [Toxorhynchites rutilus septentrionalis]|uniref:glutathione S-transferase 1-like n=1 Tax=Toxorhynchites rutilus septentrionalis TaxID=329112 RepID=UPI002479CF97|nr:glutathione S-transferase 1-like [Toxorhynchites rutilus septentrionalis]
MYAEIKVENSFCRAAEQVAGVLFFCARFTKMAPITLYTTRRTPAGRAVEITAKMIGVELEVKFTDLTKKEHLTEEFLKLNPMHTVPTIVDDGVALYDSHAIIIYLVSKYAKEDNLYPKDLVTQAHINALLHFESGVLFARLRGTLEPIFYQGCGEVPTEKLNAIHGAYDLLEGALQQSDYLVGISLTLADISVSTSLATLHALFPVDAQKCPKLVAYIKRLEQNIPDYAEYNSARADEANAFFKQKLEENKKK